MGNMRKQVIAHGLDQCFRSLGIVNTEAVLAGHLENCHNDHRQSHEPQISAQVAPSADAVYKLHHNSRKIPFLTADGAVHRCTDDLRLQHICQGRHRRRQNCHQKIPLGSPQKLPEQLQFISFLSIFILCVHTRFSFSQNPCKHKKGAGRSLRPDDIPAK